MKNSLILIRGLPGSGKSTFAKSLVEGRNLYAHVEADDYFMIDGVYNFQARELPMAHRQCQHITSRLLSFGYSVVVSNTFTQKWEMETYIHMAAEFSAELFIITMNGNFGSIHNVPDEAIARMKNRWED